MYYGWIVVGVTFLTILVAAGVRAAPQLLINPLETDLRWTRDGIAFAISIGLLIYGGIGPFAGRLMDRYGPRALMLTGAVIIGFSQLTAALMTELWQMTLLIGVLGGVGTGITAGVLSATVANRWFVARRGIVLGVFGAALSAGQLVFLPLIAWLIGGLGWRTSLVVLAAIIFAIVLPIFLLMRDDPADMGLEPYGGPAPGGGGAVADGSVMLRAVRSPAFWLLSATFFICGATSVGIVGTHFIPHAHDHGIPQDVAVGTLALMGSMNVVGTVASGWLTDRFDPRKLLAWYYTLRGLSLLIVPYLTGAPELIAFAIIFGLDFIATVPPTTTLCADLFGRRNVGLVFGWVFAAHQLGAAAIAYLAGIARVNLGTYDQAFLATGVIAIVGGMMALTIRRAPRPVTVPADPPSPAMAGTPAD